MAITLLIPSENSTWLKLRSPLDIKDSIKTLLRKAPQKHLLMFIPTKECSVVDRKHVASAHCLLLLDDKASYKK